MEQRVLGAIKSPKDLRNYRIAKSAKTIVLPEKFELNHTHIKNQSLVGSCVAHSVSSVLEAYDGVNYSTGWIYGYRPDNYYQGEGMIPVQAIKTLFNVGYVPNEDFDVNVEMNLAKEVVDENITKLTRIANKKKISNYAELYSIEDIKTALYVHKIPVILCIKVGTNLIEFEDNSFVAKVPNDYLGLHAVMCYGWNEQGLLIQNSWSDEWGDKGTCTIPYNYPYEEAWAISFKKENVVEKPKYYWIRELIMKIIKLIRLIINKINKINY